MAKKELVPTKQEKARERIKNFRTELVDYRQHFDRLKKDREDSVSVAHGHSLTPRATGPPTNSFQRPQQTVHNRAELLGRRPHHTATPENPYAQSSLPNASPFAPASGTSLSFGASPADQTRESHALREQSFMSNTNAQLDEYLERGRAVLGDLGQQREMLKGTQRKLYSVANTLGVSGDTIRMVERRAKQDKWIFWAGVVLFFAFCWLVIHFLR